MEKMLSEFDAREGGMRAKDCVSKLARGQPMSILGIILGPTPLLYTCSTSRPASRCGPRCLEDRRTNRHLVTSEQEWHRDFTTSDWLQQQV